MSILAEEKVRNRVHALCSTVLRITQAWRLVAVKHVHMHSVRSHALTVNSDGDYIRLMRHVQDWKPSITIKQLLIGIQVKIAQLVASLHLLTDHGLALSG